MPDHTPIRIVVADDHPIYRDGFRTMASKFPEIDFVGEAENGKELLELVNILKPHVILTDIKMPILDGIEATRELVRSDPAVCVIALSMFDEDNLIIEMLEAGAKGYLLKNANKNEVIEAIKSVYNGQTYYCRHTSAKLVGLIANSKFNPYKKLQKPLFTEKVLEVIRLVCDQLSNKEIAEKMNYSVRTVEAYREKIIEKMNVHNTAGIVVYAIKNSIYKVR